MKQACALVLGLLLSVGAAAECECLWRGPFTKVQAEADLVISATVVGGKGNSVDVQINQVLRGQEFSEKIRIWLKTQDLCRPPAETFPSNSRWVMALHYIAENVPGGFNPGTPNVSYGRMGDYALSSCGGYYLAQTENLITGNLAEGPRWEMAPQMTPVLLELLISFIEGRVDESVVKEASRVDPAVRELMLDTKSFLRTSE